MNKPLTLDELVSIYKLMQSMLLAAESGEWQVLDKLDSQRRQLVLGQESTPLPNQRPTQGLPAVTENARQIYNEKCTEIQTLDAKITRTVLDAKQQLVMENRNMRNQIVAKQSYAQTATMHRSF